MKLHILSKCKKLIQFHWLLTFILMGVAALIFGLSSYNLFHLFEANLNYISENGWDAIKDGGAEQFMSLCGYGVISMSSFLLFKASEEVLVEKLLSDD